MNLGIVFFFNLLIINKDRNFCLQILRIVTNTMLKESMTKSMTDVLNHVSMYLLDAEG